MIDLSFANASDSLIGSSIDSDLCNRIEAGTAESMRSSRDEKPTLSNITCLSAPVDYSDDDSDGDDDGDDYGDDDDGDDNGYDDGDNDDSGGIEMVIMIIIDSHLVTPYDEP